MNANSTKARLSASRTSQPEHPPATTLPPGDLGVEPYINKKEVARRLGRTPRGVDKMMQRGQIPYYKFGYRVAYRWSEIQNHFAETCRVLRG